MRKVNAWVSSNGSRRPAAETVEEVLAWAGDPLAAIEVAAVCEMLGFDPLYVANEGKLLAIVARDDADVRHDGGWREPPAVAERRQLHQHGHEQHRVGREGVQAGLRRHGHQRRFRCTFRE